MVTAVTPGRRASSIYSQPDLCDAFQLQTAAQLTAVEAATAIFDRTPGWVGALMNLRNLAVRPFGLIGSESKLPKSARRYGVFPVVASADDYIILGLDDRHLDFRIVLEVAQGDRDLRKVTLATVVKCHNALGRAYLAVVTPFHRRIVPAMLAQLNLRQSE